MCAAEAMMVIIRLSWAHLEIRIFQGASLGNECYAGELGNGVKQISQDLPGKSGNISRFLFEI
jgi:hypothetical protein